MNRIYTICLLAGIFLVGLTYSPLFSQGYKISVTLKNDNDSPLILGNFFGESTYSKDTANRVGNMYTFEGKEPLAEGVYFVAQDKTRLFDFLVYKDQDFSLTSSAPDYLKSLETTGSEENGLFVKEMKFNVECNEEAASYLEILKDSTATDSSKEKAKIALQTIDNKVADYQGVIAQNNPSSFIARLIHAQKRITLSPQEQEADPERAVQYYKSHYWDNFDLSDPLLLRVNTPVYKEKVDNYLDRLNIQQPDSINDAVDMLAKKAQANQDTYKYLIWLLTLKYQQSNIMGLDAVYVHLYDTYFASGQMDYWANEQLRKNLKDYSDMLRGSLIGKKAPPLIMPDAQNQWHRLYEFTNKYTVIYFFDPDCHHCKIATPKLNRLFNSHEFDMGIYAVSADTSMTKMTNYSKDMDIAKWTIVNGPRNAGEEPYYKLYDAMTTPTVYILDDHKTIIAKKIPVEKIGEFLTRYEALKPRQ